MALEPRLMYDGAAAATATAAAANQPHTDASAGSSSGAASGSSASSAPTSAAPATDHAADQPATPSPTPTDTSSSANTPADSSAGGGSPAAPATPSSTAGHQIVFIDGNVPDAQALAQGVQAGIEVVILDPNSNGVQQIADYLTSHNEQNLDAIQIVSHGEEATVRLGNTIFGLADIDMFTPQLATIGQALKPGGDINFYGCNVGEGADGALFEVKVSLATGGAHVAASSGLVGAAALGGSWDLNVTLGTNDVGNPFTAATLGQYNDILTNQIWFSVNNGSTTVNMVATANVNGSAAASVNAIPPGFNGNSLSNWATTSIAVDAADGLYFVGNNPLSPGHPPAQIYEGHISVAGGGLTSIYSTPETNGSDFLGGMVFNPANHKLYFVVDDNTAPNGLAPGGGITIDTGIFTLNIAANGATSGLTKLVSWGAGSGAVNPHDIAIDNADNLLFFTDFGDSQDTPQSFNPRIEVANLTTGAIINSSLQTIAEPAGGAYYFYGIDIDPVNHKLYWVTGDPAVAAHNQVLGASYNTSTGALSGVTALFTSGTTNPLPISLAIDAANGFYYVGLNNGLSPTTIVEGSLGATNGPQTTLLTFGSGSTRPGDVFYEPAPVLTVSGSPTATPGGSAVDLSGSLTLVDTVQNIASASVTISANKQAGDTLAATTTGTNITAVYNSSTGGLALSGVDTAAHYQTVLDSVTFATSSSASTSRTITWSATDGYLASGSPTTSVTVHLPPTVTPGAGGTYTGGGSAALVAASLSLTSPSTSTLATATISIDSTHFLTGDTLSFTNTSSTTEGNIAVQSYNSTTGVLTLTSNGNTATLSQWTVALKAVTYSFSGGGDPAATKNASPDTSRILSYAINDGTVSSTAATNTLTIVHAAPTIGGTSGVNPTFAGGNSPIALDGGLTVADADSLKLASAKVTISGNFQSGIDVLTINGATSGTTGTSNAITFSYAGGVMTLTGQDTVAAYQAALRLVSYGVTTNADPTTGSTSRTITWSVTDTNADNTKNTTTSTTALTTAHTAPSLLISGSPSYAAGGSPAVLLSAATLSDPDSGGNLAGATVSITGGLLAGDTLNFSTQNGISVSSYTNGVLTLTGSSSIANYVTALKSVTFSSSAGDPTNGGADTSRTITWQVKDSNNGLSSSLSNTGTLILGVSAPPPSLTGVGGTVSYFAGGAAVTLDGSLGITDLASTTLSGATVSITGHFLLGDTLTVDTTGTNITALYSHVHGVLQLSGSDTLADYQTVLERITYSTTAPDPGAGGSANTRTISWQVNDGRASNNLSSIVTTSVDVTHVATTIAAGGSVSFTPGNGSVLIDPTVTVTDATPDPITSITAKITAGLTTGDTLAFNGGANSEVFVDGSTISGSYNAATGTLTLTAGSGTPTAADFQLAAQSVTFNNSSVTASSPGGTRTVSWTVFTANSSETSVTTTSTIVPTTPPTDPSTISNASSFAPGTSPPSGTSGLALPPGGTSGSDFSGIGTLGTGTSGIVTLGYGTSSYGTSGPGTFGFNAAAPGAFDPTLFGSGVGGPSYFDPGGGFGSGLDFSGDFTTASNDVPADSEAPITLVADSTLDIGFGQKMHKGTDDGAPAPDNAVAVANKDAGDAGHGPLQLVVDNDRTTGPDAVRAVARLVPAEAVPAAPVAGKLAFSAQLRAAGRHGLLHDRLALLESLRDGVRG